MYHALYNGLWRVLRPAARLWLRTSPRQRELLQRFHPPLPVFDAPPLWIHACSVGEVNTALPLLDALARALPEAPRLLSASTATGHARARVALSQGHVAWFPFDHPRSVARFMDEARPRALILIETEIWPNVLREAHRRRIPVILVNGRISERHFARYLRFRAFFAPSFAHITAAGMQSGAHAERIRALGARPDAIQVTGNLKFDAAPAEVPARKRQRLRVEYGIGPEDPVLVFGSTRPGDETLAAACWETLKEKHPRLRIIVAPRHLERVEEACAAFEGGALRRSEWPRAAKRDPRAVLLLDTHGELVEHYAIASLAVIGGSFYPGVEGHNPIEAAALGIPVVFGPHMKNFDDPAALLVADGGARQLPGPDALCGALDTLLADPPALQRMGTLARKTVLEQRGATERNVALILGALGEAAGHRMP